MRRRIRTSMVGSLDFAGHSTGAIPRPNSWLCFLGSHWTTGRIVFPRFSDLGERLAGTKEDSFTASHRLPTPDADVRICSVYLDCPGMPARTLGSEDRRARAGKWIENDVIPVAGVTDSICDKCNRLHGGMGRQILCSTLSKTCKALIVPNGRSKTARGTQLDIVDVRGLPFFEDGDRLKLVPVEAAHARYELVPDAQTHVCQGRLPLRGKEFEEVSAVHAGVDQASFNE